MSLALNRRCALVAHDILYLAKAPTAQIPKPYISLFVCYGCGFVQAKSLAIINGENIAKHFLEYCQTSGGPPHVLLTDTHSAETQGAIKKTIKDLNIITDHANKEILAKNTLKPYTGPRGEADISPNASTDPPNFPTQTLKNLTSEQQAMLLQDFSTTEPPLFNHITTHSPPPNLTYQAFRNTSLGRLDNKCKMTAISIRRYITRDESSPTQVNHLLQSFVYYNNFILEDYQTKMVPAALHLGTLRHINLATYYDNIARNPAEGKQIKLLQQLLARAHTHEQAERNCHKQEQLKAAKHQRIHGKLMNDEEFRATYAPFTLVFLKAEQPTRKTDHTPPF
ncbi:MAG: hypothetical protein NZ738_05925, partial [Oceanospirillaceae bacterium]|nr:hypothetical protein [Oceanospirillaceae bacterium]